MESLYEKERHGSMSTGINRMNIYVFVTNHALSTPITAIA